MIWSAGIVWGKISRGKKGGDIVSWDGCWPLDAPAAKPKKIRQHNILGVASSRVVRWWDAGWEGDFPNPGRSYGGPPTLTAKHRIEKGSCLSGPCNLRYRPYLPNEVWGRPS